MDVGVARKGGRLFKLIADEAEEQKDEPVAVSVAVVSKVLVVVTVVSMAVVACFAAAPASQRPPPLVPLVD